MLPERSTLAGDWTDDDGQVFADQLGETANAPAPPATEAVENPTARPPRPGRLLTGTITVDPAWAPTLLLPADPNRVSLVIANNSAVTADGIYVAGAQGDLQTPGQSAGEVSGANPLTLREYTGPIWVSAAGQSAPVPVAYWSVTS